jgi:shikimate dehydrogenase
VGTSSQEHVETINKETDCVASVHHLEDKEDFKQSIAESDIYCDATSVGHEPIARPNFG